MGGAVMAIPAAPGAQARATTTQLQEGVRAGRPIMIPGARPIGAPVAVVGFTGLVAAPMTAVGADDLQRLEYQREGGGASGFRRGLGFLGVLLKIWRRR